MRITSTTPGSSAPTRATRSFRQDTLPSGPRVMTQRGVPCRPAPFDSACGGTLFARQQRRRGTQSLVSVAFHRTSCLLLSFLPAVADIALRSRIIRSPSSSTRPPSSRHSSGTPPPAASCSRRSQPPSGRDSGSRPRPTCSASSTRQARGSPPPPAAPAGSAPGR